MTTEHQVRAIVHRLIAKPVATGKRADWIDDDAVAEDEAVAALMRLVEPKEVSVNLEDRMQAQKLREINAKNLIDGIPRRNRLDHNTPSELAIRDAICAVEDAGCHQLLTEAVNLLQDAREKVADYVDFHQEVK